MTVHKFIKQIQESDSFKKFKKEIGETSVTGMVAGYQTPKAFSANSEDFEEKNKETAEVLGYTVAPDTKKKKHTVSESSSTTAVGIFNVGESFVDYGFEEDDNRYFEDDNEQKPHPSMKKTVESAGYKPIKKVVKEESSYRQVMKILHEASYKEYKGDKTRTTGEKINNSIKELNQALLRVEQAVGHALRLKTEMAVDQRTLWRSSHSRLVKIGERLNRIGKKINELGA